MAASDQLTLNYRRQTLALRAATIRDLQRLWPALNWRDLERTYPAWFAGASALVIRDRARATGLATAYLRAHRLAAGVAGEPDLRPAPPIDPERMGTALRVTTLVAVKRAAAAGQTADQAMRNAFVQSTGAATRLVLDAGRETVRRTALADGRTEGWRRVTVGGCDFCRMLAGRGAVYREETADFHAHDHCACAVEPVYR